ncbi:retroviral-like aspartic protease family protein [Caulobacter hibisci]|uniref:Aspartyl protease family protein n=1 Tax=Caulobacter hibisci TaxID=2035993 RepID=A0ABS0SVS2_9CAUL|nr:retroviral-like aspartic protease family protein [Caulobacter hibisci]MBI1683740.1 aspartyl protease family protein [Caulobacter hibisci]
MFTRRTLACGLGASLAASPLAAHALSPGQVPPTVSPAEASPPPVLPTLPLYVIDTSLDDSERMTVETTINGQGPYRFVVDSGADRSVISEPLAAQLQLPRGRDVMVHGIGGSAITPTARIDHLATGEARLAGVELPILEIGRVGGDGLLGVDILQDRAVVMDFKKKRLEVRHSTPEYRHARRPQEVQVMGDERFGRLTVVNCRVNNIRTLAFIDSGAGSSIGNMALSRAIQARQRRGADPALAVRLLGVAGGETIGEYRVLRSMNMGDLRMTNLAVVFADLHIFEHWKISDKPAILLGVDVLKLFARVELDFGSEQLLFRLGAGRPTLQA